MTKIEAELIVRELVDRYGANRGKMIMAALMIPLNPLRPGRRTVAK